MRDAERIRLAEHLLALERALRDALTAVEGIRRVVEHADEKYLVLYAQNT